MARSWLWPKANFDGASFYVDASELQRGRRLVIHEYPGAERHDVEDMGRKAGRIELTAYFVSETADIDSAALRARIEQGGAGMLVIPMFGALRARAIEGRPVWNRQALNYVGFQVTFVEEGSAFAPAPLGLGEAGLAFMAAGLAATVANAVQLSVPGDGVASAQADFILSDMREASIVVADDIERFRAATPLPANKDSDVRLTIADARSDLSDHSADAAGALATLGGALDTIVTEASGGDPVQLLVDMTDKALKDRQASLGQWGISPLVSIVPLAAAVFYAAQAARLYAVADYLDRGSAQAARAKIGQLAGAVTAVYAELGAQACAAFDDIYGLAARHLSSRIPDLAPVIIVELGVSLPSNVLAYRLYGDPNRGLELAQRNRVATPCFMPTVFEAAAR
jgi:prophage DNA circulation protein